jgi:heme exporter protein CcmD
MSGAYAGFILASYGAAILILGGMVVGSILEYRSAKARLAHFENDRTP